MNTLRAYSIAFCGGVLLVFTSVVPSWSDQLSHLAIVFPILAPKLSSEFGARRHPVYRSVRHHSGVDLAAPQGSHVRAVLNGQVIFADRYGTYGKLVSILHRDGYTSLYGHLSEISVTPGTRIEAGAIIGRVGETGTATGPHLHFEWRKSGKALDPLEVFPALAEGAEG